MTIGSRLRQETTHVQHPTIRITGPESLLSPSRTCSATSFSGLTMG